MAYEDMVDILEHYKKYVPCKTVILSEPIPGTDCTEDKEYVHTLIGGDYLSVARARGAQHIRRTSELEIYRLDGLLPVTEDWHAKVCLLEVCKINICVFCIKLFFFFFFSFFSFSFAGFLEETFQNYFRNTKRYSISTQKPY